MFSITLIKVGRYSRNSTYRKATPTNAKEATIRVKLSQGFNALGKEKAHL